MSLLPARPAPLLPSAAGPGRRRPDATIKRWDCTDFPPPAASYARLTAQRSAPTWLLAHLSAGESGMRLSPASGRRLARFFVVGGVPFGERLLMWWNFVARSGEEITRARQDWVAGRFPEVHGYPGDPLAAPPLPPVPLKPR
jgi:pirin-like protein